MSTSRVEIDLSRLDRNTAVLRTVAQQSGTRLCAVLKQDAYGMGSVRIAKRLEQRGVDMLAVYTPDEARTLVESSVTTPILVLMPVHSFERTDPLYRRAVSQPLYAASTPDDRSRGGASGGGGGEGGVHLTVHGMEQLVELERCATTLGLRLPVHLQVDTGMSRGGARLADADALVQRINASDQMRLAGVFTHFSAAQTDGDFTREQSEAFAQWLDVVAEDLPPETLIHMAESGAFFRSTHLHGSMVRIGLALYGFGLDTLVSEWGEGGPIQFGHAASRLQGTVRWTSRIVHVTEIPTGWPVGYGQTWRARRPTKIALVPVGYADGYPRMLGNKGVVGLSGRDWNAPIQAGTGFPEHDAMHYSSVVGQVSMDQITVDVTDAPPHLCRVGAEVELFGADTEAPTYLGALGARGGFVPHELMCRMDPRARRVYLTSDVGQSQSGPNTGGVMAVGQGRVPA